MRIEGTTYSVDLEWDKEGKPVLWVKGQGRVTVAKDAIDVIKAGVQMINEGTFEHVCAVYDVLDVEQIPMLLRFIRAGAVPTSQRTAHIILGTHNMALQVVGSLMAVAAGKRLRTLELCKSREEINAAVQKWLALPVKTREYTISKM